MTSQQVLHVVFSFLPFAVCLFWFICFTARMKKNDKPQQFFTVYLLACVVLYLCHALFFTSGVSYEMECVWTLCSLSVYPLFYAYLCRLTSSDYSVKNILPWLAPGTLVAMAKYAFPDYDMDKVRMLLFACQIICVCYFGIRKLNEFDKKLQAVYADTESRDTTDVHHLLVAIIMVSILSGVANSIGKQFFGESIWLLIPISLAFSAMLFSLSYICFLREFTIDQLNLDNMDAEYADDYDVIEDEEAIGKSIDTLMLEQHFYLNKDLNIGDVAIKTCTNRTYVSKYINDKYNCSFSAYINKLRIEYAKELLASLPKSTKLSQIAEESGFASEQTFFRNFKKMVGITPAEWKSNAPDQL